MYKYLLFDLDRTLWDFEGNADITFQNMYNHFQLKEVLNVDYELFHSTYRQINATLWEAYRNGTITKEILYVQRFSRTLEYFHAEPSIIGKMSREMGDFYVVEGPKQKGLMPNSREMLEELTKLGKYSLCIITNGFSEAQLPKMRTSNIIQYFQHFFLSEDLGVHKPDPRFFQRAMAKINAEPEECLVIGDDFEVDIVGAHSAGLDQIYYNPHGNTSNKPFIPTFEIKDLLEIPECLKELD